MEKKRILVYHTIPFFAGGERFILELMTHVQRAGMVPMIVGRSNELLDQAARRGITAIATPWPGLKRSLNPLRLLFFLGNIIGVTPGLINLIRSYTIDLIYVNSWDAFLLVGLAAKLTRRPIILHVHEITTPHRITRVVFRLIGSWADRVIGVSDAVVRHLGKELRISMRKLRRIHNGIDLGDWPVTVPAGRTGKIIIATAGRIGGHKGQHIFIASAKEILKMYRAVEFWIIGEAIEPEWKVYQDSLVQDVQSSGLQAHIRFMGWHRTLAAVLKPADIIVVPSLFQDPFPYSVLEAMAMGKPVVATKVGGIPEMIVDGKTGFLVPPGDSVQLTTALTRLIASPSLRKKIGFAARRRIEDQFTADRSFSQIVGVIDTVLQ